MILWCPVAMALLLAACGGGAPSVSGATSPPPGATGTDTDTEIETNSGTDSGTDDGTVGREDGGLAAPDGDRLDEALDTTDLVLMAEVGAAGIELVASNQGPNPADDVWPEIGPASSLATPAGIGCEPGPTALSCPLGPIMAREEARLTITVSSGARATAEVVDRAGHDADPADNHVEVVTGP